MPLTAALRCDEERSPGDWRALLLETPVAGLFLLKRHLLTFAHAGIRDVTLAVPRPIVDEIRDAALACLPHGMELRVVGTAEASAVEAGFHGTSIAAEAGFYAASDGAGTAFHSRRDLDKGRPHGVPLGDPRTASAAPEPGVGFSAVLDQQADIVVDPRLIAQIVRLIETRPVSMLCVDREDAACDPKSPYKVGVADLDEAKLVPGGFGLPASGSSRFDAKPSLGTERDARPGSDAERPDSAGAGSQPALVPIGIRVVARGAEPAWLDVGRYYWHRIDGPDAAATATSKVLLATMKPTDGIYARTNRRVSLRISRVLLHTAATPNMVTLATLGCSALAGWLFAMGHYPALVAGSFAGWFASMLDGVDGELARARFQASAFGHWLEMTCDYASYIFLALGLGIGVRHVTGSNAWLFVGVVSALGVVASFMAVTHLKRGYAREGGTGEYYVAYQKTVRNRRSNPFMRLMSHLTVFATRAAFPYYFVLFSLFNLGKLMLVLFLVATQWFWLAALYTSRVRMSAE